MLAENLILDLKEWLKEEISNLEEESKRGNDVSEIFGERNAYRKVLKTIDELENPKVLYSRGGENY